MSPLLTRVRVARPVFLPTQRNAAPEGASFAWPLFKNATAESQTTRGATGNAIHPDPLSPQGVGGGSAETSTRFLLNYLFNGGRERHLITQRQI